MSDAAVTKWELPDLFSQTLPVSSVQNPPANHLAPSLQESDASREQGFEQGRREGLAAVQQEFSSKIQALNSLLAHLESPLAQIDQQISRELIQLSVRLAETIIHSEIERQPELIERQVSEALKTLTSAPSDICLRLHPEDAKILEEGHAELNLPDEGMAFAYRVIADPSLKRGGCVLKTPTTLIDATIEKQLQDLLVEMLATQSPDQAPQQTPQQTPHQPSAEPSPD